MSLITRCPACGTMFKVVPDQLRISDGWVRCGHCSEVFDATQYMQAEGALVTGPGTAPAQAVQDPQTPQVQASEQPLAPPALQAPVQPLPQAPLATAQSEAFASSLMTDLGDSRNSMSPTDSVLLREAAELLTEGPLDKPFVLQRVPEPAQPQAGNQSQFSTSRPALADSHEPELSDLSFVRQARSREFWSRPLVRGALVALLVISGLLMAVQVGFHERDRLFASQPVLRPWLVQLCDVANCAIGPPRQIEAVAIEGSSFNKIRPDTYRLNITLRNLSKMELAMPAVELTLTDAQDQPVVRRVLTPQDLQSQGVIPAGGDWASSLALAVASNGVGSRIAGYRVLAFYP
ncbi:DUF3426 domain-containing protein [Caenimonas sp. SL110]|uniref:DUF3426 domain-containing protein n=1 Tax=Caenimonas sp. SL110 TaxID=1450524 RepID=UPI00069D7091|nr:DUF3426 domain-containing protein [Caenimonas sp. SL110]